MHLQAAGIQETILEVSHQVAARVYEWMAGTGPIRCFMEPLRREVAGHAHGTVLEVGAGSGLNFSNYDPERITRVVAVEPDAAMLRLARRRVGPASAPIELVQAPVEVLPFPDACFDSAVATLVFCSVLDPMRGLDEVRCVLRPGGPLVPATTRLAGNCHWNRATKRAVRAAGFEIAEIRRLGGLQRVIVVESASGRANTQ